MRVICVFLFSFIFIFTGITQNGAMLSDSIAGKGDSILYSPKNGVIVEESVDTITMRGLAISTSGENRTPGNLMAIDTAISSNFDRIITIDNKLIIANILKVGSGDISFIYPLNTVQNEISRDLVNYVIYEDGKKEIFTRIEEKEIHDGETNKSFLIVKEKKAWEEVSATYDKEETAGMTEIEEVVVEFQSNKMRATSDYLEKNALIILRKKAANVGGELVLITNKQINKAYGDLPSIEMEGIAYSKTIAGQ